MGNTAIEAPNKTKDRKGDNGSVERGPEPLAMWREKESIVWETEEITSARRQLTCAENTSARVDLVWHFFIFEVAIMIVMTLNSQSSIF